MPTNLSQTSLNAVTTSSTSWRQPNLHPSIMHSQAHQLTSKAMTPVMEHYPTKSEHSLEIVKLILFNLYGQIIEHSDSLISTEPLILLSKMTIIFPISFNAKIMSYSISLIDQQLSFNTVIRVEKMPLFIDHQVTSIQVLISIVGVNLLVLWGLMLKHSTLLR